MEREWGEIDAEYLCIAGVASVGGTLSGRALYASY